ncbi:MAG TPA: alpha/beta hydrolase [Streptosporangiaceae bacterium]|nr:alpha/beta hydrolase [Streptosporangiaceae bacterium]
MTTSPAGRAWRSRWADIDGPVRYLDFGGPARGPLIVAVHGLSGSAMNWLALAPLLTQKYRVLAVDLAGHGLTQSEGRGTDVAANRMLLHRFCEAEDRAPVILMGNSMGGMISLLEASAAPDTVAGLILVDPALPFVPSRPDLAVAAMFTLGGLPVIGDAVLGRIRSLPPERVVALILSLCCADPSRVPPDVIAQHVDVARERAGFANVGSDLASATRSVIATAGLAGAHAYRQAVKAIAKPVLLLHGERDRLVPVSAARAAVKAHPSWSLVELAGAGHVPQLEVPEECAAAIITWLTGPGRSAAEAATPGGKVPGWRPRIGSTKAAFKCPADGAG